MQPGCSKGGQTAQTGRLSERQKIQKGKALKEFLFVVVVGLVCVLLAAAGVPVLLLAVAVGGGFVWLLATAPATPPDTPKEKTTPTGCPFLDKLP